MASIPASRHARPLVLQELGANSTWLLLSRVILQVQTALLGILIARGMGEVAFGRYSLVAALIVFGNVITSFGTDTLLIRQVAGARRASIEEVPLTIGLQVLFSVGFVALIWLWTAWFPPDSIDTLLALRVYSLSLLPLALFSVSSAVLRGLERMDLFLINSLSTAFLQLFAVGLIHWVGGSLPDLMIALLAVQICGSFSSYWLCKKAASDFSFRWNLDPQHLTRLLRAAWPLAALSILGVVYLRLEIFALSSLGTAAQTGLFSAVARVVEALKLGHIAILGALLPALSRLGKPSRQTESVERLLRKTMLALVGIGSLGAALLFLFARPVVGLLYGSGYIRAVPALQVLAWMLIPYSISSAIAVYFVARRKEKLVSAALVLSLLLMLVLNIWLIPRMGIQGASLAALSGEALQAAILLVMKVLSI